MTINVRVVDQDLVADHILDHHVVQDQDHVVIDVDAIAVIAEADVLDHILEIVHRHHIIDV